MALLLLVAETTQLAVVVAPIVVDLNEELQEDLLVEETLQILACLHTYALQLFTLVTDDDALLAVARNVDRRCDASIFLFVAP